MIIEHLKLTILFLKCDFSIISSKYANTIPRPFGVRYNPYTQSIEVLDSKHQIEELMQNLNTEFQTLQNAFKHL